nr:NAD(P)-dependent oxidoreductase [Phaeacidiphilus oryzae]
MVAADSSAEQAGASSAPDVLVPWEGLEKAHGPWPSGVGVRVWDGSRGGDGEPVGLDGTDLARIGLWVMPYATPGAERLLPRLTGLRAVMSLSAGVEKLQPLLPEGVALHNGRGLHDASTAEHALGLILAAQRDLPRWVRDQDAGRWEPHFTRSLADSRVAVIGYGSIGAALERRLLACEAEVLRIARRARPAEDVHPVAELPRLLPEVDIAVLVLPENPSTVGLLGRRSWPRCRTGRWW